MKKVLKTIFRFLTGEFVHREVDRYIEEMITYDEFKLQLKKLEKEFELVYTNSGFKGDSLKRILIKDLNQEELLKKAFEREHQVVILCNKCNKYGYYDAYYMFLEYIDKEKLYVKKITTVFKR